MAPSSSRKQAPPPRGLASSPGIAATSSKKAPSIRTLGKPSSDHLNNNNNSSATPSLTSSPTATTPTAIKRSASITSQARSTAATATKQAKSSSAAAPSSSNNNNNNGTTQKYRANPRLPHDSDAEPAPSTVMYWSKAPVWGAMPMRTMRGHSVTLVDSIAWLIGGCDDKDSTKELYCFNTETMQWLLLDTIGDHPPATRAHSATLVDRTKIVVIGGGLGPAYYSSVYVFDTAARRWRQPHISPGPSPSARRAHSAAYYKGKIWVFGGGNGLFALSDLWTLDVAGGALGSSASRPMRWEEVQTTGMRPTPRGYHSANLVGNVMVVLGGSDSKECYTEVWCLNLDTLHWTSSMKPGQQVIKRLAHTATQVGSYIFVIAGHTGTEYVSEILLYDLVSLQYEGRPRFFLGKGPTPRGYHQTILADSRLFLFGGFNGFTPFDDVYILDLAAGAYLPQVTSFTMGSAA